MVDLVLVQADRAHEVDLDLVAGRDAAHERRAVATDVLGDREDRRDVVARVRVLGREERVVVVELAHGDAVRPRRPLGARAALERAAEHRRARCRRPTRRGRAPAARAALTGARVRDAAATAALSMTRLMIMSTTSASTSTGSAATSAMRQASWPSRARCSSLRWTRRWWVTVMLLPARCRVVARARRTRGCGERVVQVHVRRVGGEVGIARRDRRGDQPVLGDGGREPLGVVAREAAHADEVGADGAQRGA